MSQIAEAFVIPANAMAQAAACCDRGDHQGMRAALAPHSFEPFTWSGYIIAVLVEWLREQSIEPPRSDDPVVQRFVETCDPLLCARAIEVSALAARLKELDPASSELARYWREFTGDDTPEATKFMADGWNWLTRVVGASGHEDWCIVLCG
jgi:hypothetical protein